MTDRFASIEGLLPTRPATITPITSRDTPTAATTDPRPASNPRQDERPASPTIRAARTRPRPKTSEASDGGTRRVAFRLDPGLHQQLTARAAHERTSNGNIVLDALQAAHDADALTPRASQPEQHGMFVRTPTRTSPTPTVLVEIRLHARALAEVDRLVTATGAATRTQLLHAALAYYLPGTASDK